MCGCLWLQVFHESLGYFRSLVTTGPDADVGIYRSYRYKYYLKLLLHRKAVIEEQDEEQKKGIRKSQF